MEDIYFVVIHTPGPAWQDGVAYTEQPGVMEHVGYYAKWHEAGKLALGGPFLTEERGGMMVTVPGMTQEEVEAFAAADPAVESGLLKYEVIPWRVVMRG